MHSKMGGLMRVLRLSDQIKGAKYSYKAILKLSLEHYVQPDKY